MDGVQGETAGIKGPLRGSVDIQYSEIYERDPSESLKGGGEKVRSQWHSLWELGNGQTADIFSNGRALYTLFPAPRLCSNLLTLCGHPSLARHDQDLADSKLTHLLALWALTSYT